MFILKIHRLLLIAIVALASQRVMLTPPTAEAQQTGSPKAVTLYRIKDFQIGVDANSKLTMSALIEPKNYSIYGYSSSRYLVLEIKSAPEGLFSHCAEVLREKALGSTKFTSVAGYGKISVRQPENTLVAVIDNLTVCQIQ